MAEGYAVLGEPHLKRTREGLRGIAHEMGEAVIGNRLPPMPQNRLSAPVAGNRLARHRAGLT